MPAKAAAATSSQGEIYDQVESLLRHFSPPFTVGPGGKVGSKRHYDLVSKKEVLIDGRKRTEHYFASVIEQKGYIGFYFSVPLALRPTISPRLLKTLKGKSCFHITSLDDVLLADMKAALELGLQHFRSQGWV